MADDLAEAGKLPQGLRGLRHRGGSRVQGQPRTDGLLSDAGIVRNRAKVSAVITNARAALELPAGLSNLVLALRRRGPGTPGAAHAFRPPSQTPASKALSAELRKHGFVFTGPVTAYATMQACGLVNDHLAGCFAR